MSTAAQLDKWTFALALFSGLLRRPGNLVFSPHGIRAVLGMAQAGARGETATEIGDVLAVPVRPPDPYGAIADLLGRGTRDKHHGLALATSLWAQEGTPLRPEFLRAIGREHGGEAHSVDFLAEPEAVRGRINRWVEERTNRTIRDLIAPGALDAECRLVLASALHFKAAWQDPFKERCTWELPFHLDGHRSVPARLMLGDLRLRHFGGDCLQAVELDYAGSDLSMLILLPDRVDGLGELEARLSPRMLASWVAGLQPRRVEIHLPKFRFSWGKGVADNLEALGMRRAFSRHEADFSGINGHRAPDPEAFWIGDVAHKAFIEVNEAGTEAAAASAMMLSGCGELLRQPPIIFHADHPFLFAIRDRSGDDLLFLGRVTDPTS